MLDIHEKIKVLELAIKWIQNENQWYSCYAIVIACQIVKDNKNLYCHELLNEYKAFVLDFCNENLDFWWNSIKGSPDTEELQLRQNQRKNARLDALTRFKNQLQHECRT